MAEKLGLYPAGAHRHHADALLLKLNAERAGEAQHICLRRAVYVYIRHRLPRRHRAHVVYPAARGHVRYAHVAHRGKRAVVQVDDVKLLVHVHLREHAEQTEACRVDENGDFRLLALQQGAVRGEACAILKVERERAHPRAALGLQFAQPVLAAGDDPQLVKFLVAVKRIDKFAPHSGRSACDNCNFHGSYLGSLKLELSISYFAPEHKGSLQKRLA